jgi:hypothetical protein
MPRAIVKAGSKQNGNGCMECLECRVCMGMQLFQTLPGGSLLSEGVNSRQDFLRPFFNPNPSL